MSNITIPEIRINYSWLLKLDVSQKIARQNNLTLPTDSEARSITEQYRCAWKMYGDKILFEMQRCLGLKFYKSIIDVHTAPYILPKAQPLIIHLRESPDRFIDTLTHELAHVLLTDNTTISLLGEDRDINLVELWQNLFGNENEPSVVTHIPVHAVLKQIIFKVFNDESRIDRDKEFVKKYDIVTYQKSWDYVEKVGHEEIIAKLKKSYAEIANNKEKS
jgi:hypothetical protein